MSIHINPMSPMAGPGLGATTERQSSADPLNAPPPKKSKRGFASMDPQRQREIASLGGRIAHQKGTGHQWTSEEARLAGQKGGRNAQRRRAASTDQDREQE